MADIQPQAFDGMSLAVVAIPLKGNDGDQGEPGLRGLPGKSNYQIWLEAGNSGTEEEFLEAMRGPPGEDGKSLTNRGDWVTSIYNPGDYVFAEGTTNERSMWITTAEESFISQVPPNMDLGNWAEFSTEKGDPGADGSLWFIKTTNPDPLLGKETDCWLNVTTGDVWQKTDAWGSPIGTLSGGGSGGGGVASVNNKMPDSGGNVTLTATDVGAATTAQGGKADTAVQPDVLTAAIDGVVDALKPVAFSGEYTDLTGKPTLGTAAAQPSTAFATAAQGAKADSAVQAGSLATVATSGIYNDLTGKPVLGTAASQSSAAFATAAQGAKADSAVQPGSLATVAVTGSYNNLIDKPTLGTAAGQPSTAFATAAQGAKADTAVQPGALATVATSGSYIDLINRPIITGRNAIINGMMQVWQRNNIFAAAAQTIYTADRWKLVAIGSTGAVTRDDYQLGSAPSRYICRVTSVTNNAAGSAVNLQQPIEDVRTYSGKVCTLSFWAIANVNGFVSAEVTQNFGAGGSATVEGIGATKIPVTTSWQRYSVTFTMPSVSGKVLGTANDCVNAVLWIDAGSNFSTRTAGLGNQSISVSLSGIRLDEGSSPANDETPYIGDELARCQRYFCKSYAQSISPGSAVGNNIIDMFFPSFTTGRMGVPIAFPVEMRGTPAMVIYDTLGAQNSMFRGANGAPVSLTSVGSRGAHVYSNSGISAQEIGFHYTADAEF